MLYNINGASMRSLVKEHVFVLKLKENKISKKTETEPEELQRYISFLERKKNATFEIKILCGDNGVGEDIVLQGGRHHQQSQGKGGMKGLSFCTY